MSTRQTVPGLQSPSMIIQNIEEDGLVNRLGWKCKLCQGHVYKSDILTLQNPLNSRFATVLSNAYAVKYIRGKSATVAGRKTDERIPQLPFLDYIQQYRT